MRKVLLFFISGLCPLFCADTPSVLPDEALARLQEGNAAWVARHGGTPPNIVPGRRESALGPHPIAAILSCNDSAVPPEDVFHLESGTLLSVRSSGAVAEEAAITKLEKALERYGIRLLIVMGHTSCDTVKAAMDRSPLAYPTPDQQPRENLLNLIPPALPAPGLDLEPRPTGSVAAIGASIGASIEYTSQLLRRRSPTLDYLVREGRLRIIGAVYDEESGRVSFGTSAFVPLVPVPGPQPGSAAGRPSPLAIVD